MDAWTYQGIEILSNEKPTELYERICRLEATLGLSVTFQAIGTFRAPMSKTHPPRFSPKGQPRQFLHVTWQQESAQAWAILLHIAEKDRRALLSSFTSVGFLARDVDLRDGHPRESVLLAAFNSDAQDFSEPLTPGIGNGLDQRAAAWRASIEREASQLRREGVDPAALAIAIRLAEAHRVRFEHGWYLSSGDWRSRYLVISEGSSMAIAAAQESLCTCASRYPETLQLMMPSNVCTHHLAAKLVERVAETAFVPVASL